MTMQHVPPGRMGRLWLLGRLELAERAVSLLEEKLCVLSELRAVLEEKAAQTRGRWQDASRDADEFGIRAMLFGGQRAITMATPREDASVKIRWSTTAGVRHPDRVVCGLPSSDDPAVIHTSSATVQAAEGYREALVAAAEYATARSALSSVERELNATRLRARALSRHWLPHLRDGLARIELQLEEQERAEAINVRLVDLGS